MLTKKIKYVDFSGNDQESILNFNLTQAEVVRWLMSEDGIIERLENIHTRPGREIVAEFDSLIRMSFGVKSHDGKRFAKSDEIYADFLQTAAYDAFFMEIMGDPKKAEEFVRGILPAELLAAAKTDLEKREGTSFAKPEDASETSEPAAGASGI